MDEDKCTINMYDKVCKDRFDQQKDRFDAQDKVAHDRHQELTGKFDAMWKKMYQGNGGKPIDVQLSSLRGDVDRLAGKWKYVMAGLGAVLLCVLPYAIKVIAATVQHVCGKVTP